MRDKCHMIMICAQTGNVVLKEGGGVAAAAAVDLTVSCFHLQIFNLQVLRANEYHFPLIRQLMIRNCYYMHRISVSAPPSRNHPRYN